MYYLFTFLFSPVVPLLKEIDDIKSLLSASGYGDYAESMASLMADNIGTGLGTKTILRLGERALATAAQRRNSVGDIEEGNDIENTFVIEALRSILEDHRRDEGASSSLCEVL